MATHIEASSSIKNAKQIFSNNHITTFDIHKDYDVIFKATLHSKLLDLRIIGICNVYKFSPNAKKQTEYHP
jgi:hypothetical protein